MNRFQEISYKITFDRLRDDYVPSLEESNYAIKTFEYINSNKKITPAFLNQLENMVDKYPKFPALKNYLLLAYRQIEEVEAFDDLLAETLEVHPDYLFARTLVAEEYLKDNEPKKAAEMMANFTDLTALYPHRDIFHISEVQAYHGMAAQYFAYIGDEEQSEVRLDLLEKVGVDSGKIRIIGQLCEKYKMQGNIFRMTERQKEIINQDGVFKAESIQTDVAPIFQNPLIEELYHNDFSISESLVERILALPRESLIEDLEKVIKDGVLRYRYFNDTFEEFDETQQSFVLHAIFLLGELKSYDSLPVILDLLRQGDEFCEYWFSDAMEAFVLRTFHLLGSEQLEVLASFLKEPNIFWMCKSNVSNILRQIAIFEPQKREKVLAIFEDTLNFYYENQDNVDIFDDTVVGSIIGDIADIGENHLLPLIEKMYDANLVDDMLIGDWENMKESFDFPATFDLLPIPTLMEQYKGFINGKYPYEYIKKEFHPTLKKKYSNISSLYEKNYADLPKAPTNFQPSYTPVISQKIDRNEKVSVKYTNGKVIKDIKYKKVEADIKAGKCSLV